MSDEAVTVGIPYAPPSNTVIRTQFDGWYYVPIDFLDAVDEVLSDAPWAVFEVAGNEATTIMIRKSTITAIIDLTQES